MERGKVEGFLMESLQLRTGARALSQPDGLAPRVQIGTGEIAGFLNESLQLWALSQPDDLAPRVQVGTGEIAGFLMESLQLRVHRH